MAMRGVLSGGGRLVEGAGVAAYSGKSRAPIRLERFLNNNAGVMRRLKRPRDLRAAADLSVDFDQGRRA
jgi:hypothetical protein